MLASVAICASLALAVWPLARQSGDILLAQDDPPALADAQLAATLKADPAVLQRNLDEAIAAGDSDLAQSVIALAGDKGIVLSADATARAAALSAEQGSAGYVAGRFASGLITGEADDIASLSGTVAGDLFVFGDIRDVVREGKRLAFGEEADTIVLGLAAAGLAVTAATYATVGGVAPVRAGLTLVKDARKLGRIGEGLVEWTGRRARDVIDGPALREAVTTVSLTKPAASVAAIKAAFRSERAAGLFRLGKDVGRVSEKAGARGALDAVRIAQGPGDVARAAKLAEKKGSQTRAFFKVLGRGSLLLLAGAVNLWLWVLGAALSIVGMLVSIKSATERGTRFVTRRAASRRADRRLQVEANRTAAALA